MKYLPAAFLLLMIPLAAGCGGAAPDAPDVASAGTGTATAATTAPAAAKKQSPKDAEAAMLAHARCMRKHGINVPDPKPGGGELVRIDKSIDPATVDAAMKACASLVQDAGLAPTPEEMEKNFEQALKFAKCMREHGIDMPDPVREGGGIKMTIGGPGSSIDPTRMDAAQKVCAKDGPFGDAPPPSSLKPGEGVVRQAGPGK
jgi:cytosine/adenosine deaminase-related metal-dependent hydrolase